MKKTNINLVDRLHKSKILPISYLAPFISISETNAQVSSTKRFFKHLILPLAFFLFGINHSWGQSFATIGTGTAVSTSTGSDPIDGYFESFRYQVVYTAAELSAAGMPANAVISGLGFSIAGDYAGGNLLCNGDGCHQHSNCECFTNGNSSNRLYIDMFR